MYVEEICIEGFKSYAQRTVVPNFDKRFNAITGLNGSGKSNILDSICFVLGITNLSQVRASNLQELVYKQGQAGVTKASVSITFNNSDPESSPQGYESHEKLTVTRQIVIGGRNKYLINGHVAQPNRVQDLFHSVQLNVNNPHFLIMQGRITKVLNMKPPEILSMLEEASGTRMYETKRANALKTLEKKELKVTEINKVLEEDILPALERLKKERGEYMEWQTANDQLDRLRRFCIAYEYIQAQKVQEESNGDTAKIQGKIDEGKATTTELEEEVKEIENNIEKLTKEREEHMGAETKKLEDEVDKLSKNLVKETSAFTNKQDNLKTEQEGVKKLQKTAADLDKATAKKAATLEQVEGNSAQLRADLDTAVEGVATAERGLNDVQTGQGTGEGTEDKSLAERLVDAKTEASSSETEYKQADLKVKHLEKELVGKTKRLATMEKDGRKAQQDLERERAAVERARGALQQLGFDNTRMEGLEHTRAQARAAAESWQDRVDMLSSQLHRVDFQYRDPERNFDHSRVKGVVARLLRVREPEAAQALEVVAGGKLYNVVVDTAETGQKLLDHGQLRQRVTFIPLSHIRGDPLSQKQQNVAHQISDGSARLALSLVGYADELATAMGYVFGKAFVCRDAKSAEKVAFHKEILRQCVTLEGDKFDPSGTLTGGSRSKSSVLTSLHELEAAEAELDVHRRTLWAAEQELNSLQAAAAEHARLEREAEVAGHSLQLLETRVQQSEAHMAAQEVEQMRAEAIQCKEASAAAKVRKQESETAAKALEKEIAEFGKQREARLKKAEGKLKDAKAALVTARTAVKDREEECRALAAERDSMLEERCQIDGQVEQAQAALAGLEEELSGLQSKVAECKEVYDTAAAQLEERKKRAQECDQDISRLAKDRKKKEKRVADINVDLRKLEHKVARMEKEAKDAAAYVEKLKDDNPWILSEQQFFDQAGSDYDFKARSPKEAQKEYAELSETHERLSKKVNKAVMNMFDNAEREYKELMERRSIVAQDKSKIEQVIDELDEKKQEALFATWEKVNKDFGSIFSTLLPGTMAKLEPPEGGTVLDGLEVKVAFGSVWKQSLTELSGGQRSLLALSLILALLRFKPAPIYILDEVDAALDLSHTQNIGRMIKTHFPQSQFIVVSLKEGMFNNADVLFRTKFVDGISMVTRTTPNQQQTSQASGKGKQSATETSKRQRMNKENQNPLAA
ncbi:Structural maintenance of chromosomes protein 2 [Cymbomonas tetramitiformis]|uniref:Structural maintenance of chromosomes protein n=1 Tax=Cymbomonas tetramitiformis TaxID=36881 RepID=A0AAE0C6Z6_9CHLO|nr:Structural maintenance of chromosomes protein 2 [Cymbomonas tetramitiformis]